VIKTWKNSASRSVFETGKCKFSGLDEDRALTLLAFLNAAPDLGQIRALKGVRLHGLKGNLKGHWSITVNAGWRIVFKFSAGHAYDVEITDYH
jgi:proteic killer suppression protein